MKVNLTKPTGVSAPGAASGKSDIIIIDVQDIDVFPLSDANGVVMQGNFVLKDGEKMYTIYGTKSKTEAGMETEGEEDMMSFKSKAVVQFPGNTREIKEFVQLWTGKDIILMHKSCGENFWEVMGTPCAPLQLKTTKKDDNDGRSYNLTFEPFAKSGFVPKIYYGAVVFAEPEIVADAESVPIDVTKSFYKLPATAVTSAVVFDQFFNQTAASHGKIFTLIGSGGAAPVVLSDGVNGDVGNNTIVYTKLGVDWVALEGSTISLQLYTAGTASLLLEVART